MRPAIRMSAAVAMLLLLGAGTGAFANGSPLVGVNLRASGGSADADDEAPAVAWNSETTQYLVVWEDGRNVSDDPTNRGRDVYGQRVGADGAPIGQNFRISGGSATADDRSPAVAWNETAGEYLVVWQDWRGYDTRGHDIYGQRVSADGVVIDLNFRISDAFALDDEYSPVVVVNEATGHYLVVWQDYRNYETRGPEIYGQRLGTFGGLIATNFRISGAAGTPTASSKCWPAAAWNGSANQFLVVWEDGRNSDPRGQDIYGQRLGAYGGLIGQNFRISGGSAMSDDSQPAVAWNDSTNQFLVVWQDHRDEEPRGWDIYGQRLGAYGSLIDANFRISGGSATSDEISPAVAWVEAANRYLVAWTDWRDLASSRGADVYAQRLGPYGGAVGKNVRVSGWSADSDDWHPAAACSGSANQCLVAWQDHRDEGTRGWDIYAQRVSG